MAGSAPLHTRTHWRRLRELLNMLCVYENINYNDYDTKNIVCRETSGSLLHGKNVKCDMCGSGRSYFVSDNTYDVYEIPSKRNEKGFPYGTFLVLIHNTSFDYWLFGTLKCDLLRSKTLSTKTVTDKYFYDIFGHYTISMTDKPQFRKTRRGDSIDYGDNNLSVYCSGLGRKKSYRTSDSQILTRIGVTNDTKRISDTDTVKIYKKNNIKSRKKRY